MCKLHRDVAWGNAGSQAINPATGRSIPIWVADYVLGSYGSGAIMAVPGHDARDHEFATLFELPIARVVENGGKEDDLPFSGANDLLFQPVKFQITAKPGKKAGMKLHDPELLVKHLYSELLSCLTLEGLLQYLKWGLGFQDVSLSRPGVPCLLTKHRREVRILN